MSSDAPSEWDRLTSLATLGLARQGSDVPSVPQAHVRLPAASRETTFLRTAAASLLWKLAGERIRAAEPPVAPAVPDERRVSESAARRLARMLADEPREFVPEWLTLATRTGVVLPPAWVPPIFDALEPSLRTSHSAVFGATLQRLAMLDARWQVTTAAIDATDDAWTTGTPEHRLAALRAVRASDPGRGLAWVDSTWETDPPEFREQTIAVLRLGLSSADETFLERALDDRRKPVRSAAADTLARIRDSELVRRVLARLEPHFVLHAKTAGLLGRFSGRRLEVSLPTAADKAAQRDGIEPKPPAGRKIGERTWWFVQMLATVPPDAHLSRFGCTPDELLEAVRGNDYETEIVDALVQATQRWRAAGWIAPLSAVLRARATRSEHWASVSAMLASLIDALEPAERAVALSLQIDALANQEQASLAFDLLMRVDAPWSAELTQRALRVLEDHVHGQAKAWPPPRSALVPWAARVDLEAAAPLLERYVQKLSGESPWRNAVERLHDLVRFRIEMRKELVP